MNFFKEKVLHIGEVPTNKSKKIIFEGNGVLPKVKRITTSCGCTKAVQSGNNIVVTFSSGTFPRHLVGMQNMETMKQLIVYFQNGDKEVLTFKATITKK